MEIPSKVDINAITSIELDLAEDFSIKKPWQVVNNQLLIYETNYMLNNFKFEFYAGHFINNLKEYGEKLTRPAFDLEPFKYSFVSKSQIYYLTN